MPTELSNFNAWDIIEALFVEHITYYKRSMVDQTGQCLTHMHGIYTGWHTVQILDIMQI
jgi:hypothetical protein